MFLFDNNAAHDNGDGHIGAAQAGILSQLISTVCGSLHIYV